nr:unnamed protein product [Callosobruchus chinensis]
MVVPRSLLTEIDWWLHNIHCSGKEILPSSYSLEIYSDTSTTGFGAWCGEKEAKDSLSRNTQDNTEFELNQDAFVRVVERFGQPQIDLFASQVNAKCDMYVSWGPDPDSFGVDAFTLDWSDYYFYAFPPFSLINRVEESSLIQTPFPGVREAIRERLRQKSIPEETIPIILASLSDNTNKPQLCVASTLEYYLTKTSSYRSSTHRLLLTHQRPFHVATTQSISRWVKEILQRSGIDLVRKTAGWSDKSTAFNEFYNLPLATNQEEFARCIINTKS